MSGALVFSSDTLVRFRSGRILVHTTSSPLRAFESDQPALIGWLCQFATPTLPDAALAQLPAQDRAQGSAILDYLQRGGALIAADGGAAGDEAAADLARTRNHLRLLSRSFYDLACDILGLGAHAEAQLRERTGAGLERRLVALLAATDALRNDLAGLRADYLAAQLAALGIAPGSRGHRLHIGCGPGLLAGWVNIDIAPAPLAMNVLWGLPFAAGSVTHVYVSHLLEHLFYPRDVRPFLADILRVLQPGGVVRIVVPDVAQCIAAYESRDATFFASRRESWPWWPADPTRLEDFLAYAGAGAEPAYLFESHKYGYDFETLSRTLRQAGFTDIVESGFMASSHAALRVDEISAVARARYGERYYSLFVEATRPA